MPSVIRKAAALLRRDNDVPVNPGDVLPAVSASGRQARVVSVVPDADGMITVQETYRARPEDFGLYIRPGSVIFELTESEADSTVADFISGASASVSVIASGAVRFAEESPPAQSAPKYPEEPVPVPPRNRPTPAVKVTSPDQEVVTVPFQQSPPAQSAPGESDHGQEGQPGSTG